MVLLVIALIPTSQANAVQITVPNHSFEYVGGVPVIVKTMGVTPDNWTFASGNDGDGIENPSTDGEVCVAVTGVDSVYQTLSHTIVADTIYTLKFDAYYLWSTGTWDCTFRGALYYRDGNSRTVIGYVEDRFSAGMPAWSWHPNYTLEVTIPSNLEETPLTSVRRQEILKLLLLSVS